MDIWKRCRKQIVSKLLPFSTFSLPSEYCSSEPDSCFTPMEHIDLSSLSLQAQEQHLVKDLFLVYMAYQGNSIRFVKEGNIVTWTVNPSSDTCLRSALYTDACLPLAATLIQLRHNIKNICCDLSRGRVALAVGCAAEEFFNSEIMPLLVKLELENRSDQRTLTLAEVATYMRPYMQITKHLNDVLATIIKEDFVGGEVLSLLAEQIRKCVSPTTRNMLQKFEVAGLEQYFELLFWWIRYGKIQDYCHDFMIWDLNSSKMFTKSDIVQEDDDDIFGDGSNNFDDRFCVVKALCPSQLEPAFEDILKCGTYLNIAEMIKGETTAFDDERIGEEEELEEWKRKNVRFGVFFVDDVVREVKKARLKASKDLVQILRKQFGLDESFHNFLLLQRSDWLVSFHELSRDVLNGSVRGNFDSYRRLPGLFKPILEKYDVFTSLRLISGKTEQKGKLRADMETTESKNGQDAFSIHINVDSPKQMNSDLVTLNDRRLLQEMLHFLNAYNLHCSVYVVPRLWDIFIGKLSKSASLEEILSFQNSFLPIQWLSVSYRIRISWICFRIWLPLSIILLPTKLYVSFSDSIFWIISKFIVGFDMQHLLYVNAQKYDESIQKWNDYLGKMHSLLSKPNNNNAYAQLHSRIFSQFY
ncbi:Gamma-tubulin complex component [Dirofilaria immitis]|nr:Gamma-tubulin complex component [Dirofilaria immitis]